MKTTFIIAILSLFGVGTVTAGNAISLLKIDKVREYLQLNPEQYKNIHSAVKQIKNILEEDKKIIDAMKERVTNGDEPGLFEKMSTKRGRGSRIDAIEDLIEEIEDQLSDEQKIKFKNIDKPVLKGLEKKEIFGE